MPLVQAVSRRRFLTHGLAAAAGGLAILHHPPRLLAAGPPPGGHPDSSGWPALLDGALSNAEFPAGVWSVADGVLTATKDEAIWTRKDYENFILDLEFKTADGTNSGVFVYCSDVTNWMPNCIEVQIADDFAEKWAKSPKNWQCGALFGHQAPLHSAVKHPGEWNRMTITCKGPGIRVVLNGMQVVDADIRRWTSAKVNPDGSPIPEWLSKPWAELPTRGRIGLQGKHAGAPIYFRNLRIQEGL